ncbi:ankyrin repeats (3 copies) domain-containing protein [Pochonia chlamydosporia 170]|uniref:Ankyrin repeats (3 copies) domain-containing protein n=1 Tax=Pochonia chlamydosporia 170 TaxID=1380566 RepID=A0A179FCQ1_METCM|nr:ankyrin repeats (3 copies) domain-containing protein [Pochonia chlamydosporia 170]OAQ63061.2 ankyrin repeats (3 copies) domain-containing protein [Pochonia chlamydosporia 170]
MEANSTTSGSLSHIFEHLSMQAEASRFWKCPFAGCTDRVPRDALPDLDVLVSLLGNLPRNLSAGIKTRGTIEKLSEMADHLAKVSCTPHREYIGEIAFYDRWDDLVTAQRAKNKQTQQVGQSRKSDSDGFLTPSTPVRSASKKDSLLTDTPGTYDDPGYFTRSNGKSRNRAMPLPGLDDLSSPYTPGADRVFDGDSPYGEVDTPGTGYSEAPVSRTLFRKQQESWNETPTRKKLLDPLSGYRTKSNDNEETTETVPKRATADAAKYADTDAAEDGDTDAAEDGDTDTAEDVDTDTAEDVDTDTAEDGDAAEDEENREDIVGFSKAHKRSSARDNDNKFGTKTNEDIDASETKLNITQIYRPDLKITPKVRAKAILHDALNTKYRDREMDVGKIYIAIDIDDPTLKGHFKVGAVTGDNTVWQRYKRDKCSRKHNLRFVAISDSTIANVYRVEKLVHKELHAERKTVNCRHCPKTHMEWFKADLQTVVSAVNRWTMFTSLASLEEDCEVFRLKVKDFMARKYTYEDFIESFMSDAGYTADRRAERRDLVTFVNINDKKSFFKTAKDVSEMEAWEKAFTKDPGHGSNSKFSSTKKGPAKVIVEEQHRVLKDSGLLPRQKPPVSSKAQNKIGQTAQQVKDIIKGIGRRKQKDLPQREEILGSRNEEVKMSLLRHARQASVILSKQLLLVAISSWLKYYSHLGRRLMQMEVITAALFRRQLQVGIGLLLTGSFRQVADVNLLGGICGTALRAATINGHHDIVKTLLIAGARVDLRAHGRGQPLYSAITNGHMAILRTLLDAGANVNNQDGETASALTEAAGMGNREAVEILLDAGANVNAKDRAIMGRYSPAPGTPLHSAVLNGNVSVAEKLVQAGADVNAVSASYGSPLYAANELGDSRMFDLLIRHGAHENAGPSFQTDRLRVILTLEQRGATGSWLPAKTNGNETRNNNYDSTHQPWVHRFLHISQDSPDGSGSRNHESDLGNHAPTDVLITYFLATIHHLIAYFGK